MPELRHLRVFVAVAETRSFTRAGERLHLQQQSVSRTVAELERQLGVELFERTTREVHLTAAGDALLAKAGAVLQAADDAFRAASEVGAGLSGVVRIGVSPAIGPADRDALVRALRSAPGEVSVAIHDVRPADVHPKLAAREIDFVVTRTVGIDDPSLHAAELRSTPLVVIVEEGHRLAGWAAGGDGAAGAHGERAAVRTDGGRAAALDPGELDGETLLVASAPGTAYTDLLVGRFAARGARVGVREARVTGGTSILLELEGTGAVAPQPAGVAAPAGMVAIPLAEITVPLWILWPAGLPSPAVRRVREQLGAGVVDLRVSEA